MNMSRKLRSNVRQKRDIAPNDISTLEKGKSFEKKVSEIFILMGFKVDRNRTWGTAGNEIDIFLEKKKSIGRKNEYYICECKNWTKPVGIDIIIRFNFVRECVKKELERGSLARDCDAIIVSPTEFTLRAKEAASVLGILLFTYDQLLAEVMNFDEYLTAQVIDYESDQNKERYIVQDFWSEGKKENSKSFDFIKQWLEKPALSKLLILGDCGIGKTSFVRQLFYRMAVDYKKNPENSRIPFLIDQSYEEVKTFNELLQKNLDDGQVKPPNKKLFLKLLSEGKILLIIDTFDQIDNTINFQTAFYFINKLNQSLEGDAKVIITARTHSFRNTYEIDSIFVNRQTIETHSNEIFRQFKGEKGNFHFEIVYLKKFSDSQIEDYFKAVFGGEWRTFLQKVRGIYHFSDLASRPIFMNSIVNKLLVDRGSKQLIPIELTIYGACICTWLEKEEIRYILPQIIESLVEELAFTLFKKGKESIHYTELYDFIRKQLEMEDTKNGAELHIADYEIRSAAFLVRDNEGNYSFAHKSLQELFIAQKIEKGLKMRDSSVLNLPLISREIIYFLNLQREDIYILQVIEDILTIEDLPGSSFENALYIYFVIFRKMYLNKDFSFILDTDISLSEEKDFSKKIIDQLDQKLDINREFLKDWNITNLIGRRIR